MTLADGRDTVALNGRRNLVTGKLDVAKHGGVETSSLEGVNWLNTSRSLLDQLELRDSREVDTLAATLLRGAKQLDLQLGELGTDVSLLAIPLVNGGLAIPLDVLVGELVVLVRGSVNPTVELGRLDLLDGRGDTVLAVGGVRVGAVVAVGLRES